MRRGEGPFRGREWYTPISILAIVARFDITNGRVLDAIARAWANAIRGRLLASKYYTKITPEGMRLRLRPMCWFSHWIDNSVSSSNIIDGGSQFIGKQWEHHIKTNGSKISKPMGARPWLLEYRAMCFQWEQDHGCWSTALCVYMSYWFRISLLLSLQRCVGIAATNALVTTWMGDLFYENMGNYPNTTIYRANKCWCEWVPNSESLLLLDNEMFKCTFIVENVFSFALSEKCLTGFTNLVYVE